MGGSAFSQVDPPILTPRMNQPTYDSMLNKTIKIISRYYTYVGSPVEAPGKETFGDIDILVSTPFEVSLDVTKVSPQEVAEKLKVILGAKMYIFTKNDPVINFAVPWPEDKHVINEINLEKRFVQVDIQTCACPQDFLYSYFYNSHGDLWHILNTIIKPFGLLVNNRGMYLRIIPFETGNRKRARVLATSDPTKILNFLGLDPDNWWEKFISVGEMFRYAASCRMFTLNKIIEDNHDDVVVVMPKPNSIPKYSPIYYNENEIVKKMNSHDLKRLTKRPNFAAWMFQFVPESRTQGLYFLPDPHLTLDQVKNEALELFHIRKEFEVRERELELEKNVNDILMKGIKGSVPCKLDPVLRAAAIRVLRQVIEEGQNWVDGERPIELQRDDKGLLDVDKVKRWVGANWMEAGKLGLARQAELSRANKIRVEEENKTNLV